MTDWAAHLGHGRRLTEPLGWLAAAAFAILLAATGASFAMWLDRRAGEGTVPDSMLLDLPPMPPAQAVSEAPTPQPDAPAAAPEQMEIAKDADGPPQTATSADTAPDLELPEDLMPLEEVAQDIPQVEPPPPGGAKGRGAETRAQADEKAEKGQGKGQARPKDQKGSGRTRHRIQGRRLLWRRGSGRRCHRQCRGEMEGEGILCDRAPHDAQTL